jgi:hypothetical protein
MSDEKFLERWSRRKRKALNDQSRSAAPDVREPSPQEASEPPLELPQAPPPGAPEALPAIEAIDASTDIRGFLAGDVPAALSRAALRRAWTCDPGIRDFVGLSENAWDFTATDGVPGFGALRADDIRRLMARVDESIASSSEAASNAPTAAQPASSKETISQGPDEREARSDASPSAADEPGPQETESPPPARRRHGGALPE